MSEKSLNSMEIDVIGEVLYISLGAASVSIASMLDAVVDVTVPTIREIFKEDFHYEEIEPLVGVEIKYEEGLTGKNIMLLKREDVCRIVGMLMGMEFDIDTFEFDEISSSAIGEVMNQMMGSSATALSELLGIVVNITTPRTFEVTNIDDIRDSYFEVTDELVEAKFVLTINENMKCNFMHFLPIDLAKDIVRWFSEKMGISTEIIYGQEEGQEEKVETEKVSEPVPMANVNEVVLEKRVQDVEKQPARMEGPMDMGAPNSYVDPQAGAKQDKILETMMQMMDLMRQQMELNQAQMMKKKDVDPRLIKVESAPRANLKQEFQGDDYETNLELVMGVPVEISAEIGRTKKYVKDVLDLNKGSLVVLDKLAGEQVDLFVNGQCIAKGDVVVVDDNFGIRITDILNQDINFVE